MTALADRDFSPEDKRWCAQAPTEYLQRAVFTMDVIQVAVYGQLRLAASRAGGSYRGKRVEYRGEREVSSEPYRISDDKILVAATRALRGRRRPARGYPDVSEARSVLSC